MIHEFLADTELLAELAQLRRDNDGLRVALTACAAALADPTPEKVSWAKQELRRLGADT